MSKQSHLNMFNAPLILRKLSIPHKIINYDTFKTELAATFLQFAKIKLPTTDTSKAAVIKPRSSSATNRSLSPSEAEIQLLVNKQFEGTQFPALFRSMLTNRPNYKPRIKNYYHSQTHNILLDRFRNNINSINSIIHGDPLHLECRNTKDTELAIAPEDISVLINAFKRLELEKLKKLPFLEKLKHKYKVYKLKNMHSDFNPQAYLQMNKDVAEANVDPYEHYSKNGYKEGRAYKFY